MILRICRETGSDITLTVTINNEKKVLDYATEEISFIVDGKKKYEIDIEEEISESNRKPISIILYILTLIIQGVFNILMVNTDSKWYRNIKPFCLKAKLLIDLHQDTNICLRYSNSYYDEVLGTWTLPNIMVEPNFDSEVSFVKNHCDFKNQYFNYIKRVVSVTAVAIAMFGLLLYIGIANSISFAIIASMFLILGAISLDVLISILEYKRFKNIYQSFLKQKSVGLD